MSDQHTPDVIGAYGNPHIRTPNLDPWPPAGCASRSVTLAPCGATTSLARLPRQSYPAIFANARRMMTRGSDRNRRASGWIGSPSARRACATA